MSTPSGGGVALPIPEPDRQPLFDNTIWYTLSLWPALTVAVTNNFGGPDSSDKRDWFAGAISDLLSTRPETDHDDLVIFLLQVMEDEFDVRVDDESEEEIAGQILGLRRRILGEGERAAVEEVERRWKGRGKLKVELRGGEEVEGEWSEVDDDGDEGGDEDGDGDVEMEEAPRLVPKKEKVLPEIDEEGFEKVVGKKRR